MNGSRSVFISSTNEDLVEYREAARDAAIQAGFLPTMQEYFQADGRRPPLEACLEKVSRSDVLVVIVAHRYGWVPDDQPEGGTKSITWLECERAGLNVLAFLVDEDADWPKGKKDSDRMAQALDDGVATEELFLNVKRDIQGLRAFKGWLKRSKMVKTFDTKENLGTKIAFALKDWADAVKTEDAPPRLEHDPREYLRDCRDETSHIDIRGLTVGSGRAHRFPITDLYIPLTTGVNGQSQPLLDVLKRRKVVLTGGAGLRQDHVPSTWRHTSCRAPRLGDDMDEMGLVLPVAGDIVPVPIRVPELMEHIQWHHAKADGPPDVSSPEWILHFLERRGTELNWKLSADYFREQMESGRCLLLLDGLDEVATARDRGTVSVLIAKAVRAYDRCRFIATTRPRDLHGQSGAVPVSSAMRSTGSRRRSSRRSYAVGAARCSPTIPPRRAGITPKS